MEWIPANSFAFELLHIYAQRCDCGGRYEIRTHHLLRANDLPIDRITAVCRRCGETRDFFFDVHTFYGEAEGTAERFAATEAALRAGIEAINRGDFRAAVAPLRRAVDPEVGEPAFGWGYYHLGMVLLVLGERAEGYEAIRRAVALVPNEAEFHRGLAKAAELLGRGEEAARARRQAEVLARRQAIGPLVEPERSDGADRRPTTEGDGREEALRQ